VPSSNSFVVWRCLHNKMPTDDNLLRRGCIIVSVCVLCMRSDETTRHLFITCPFTCALWNWLETLLNVEFDRSNFISLFDSFLLLGVLNFEVSRWRQSYTLHTIWMACNVIRFNNASINLHAAKMKI
jgi:hypothetical protein